MELDNIDYQDDELRALPVILLLDTSVSMGASLGSAIKIDKLNEAVVLMMKEFDKLEQLERFIRVTVIAFDDRERIIGNIHEEPKIFLQNFKPLTTGGMTYLGKALDKVKSILEDPDSTPRKWYKPVVILVSDGEPNGSWKEPFQKFISDGKSARSQRFSLAIGIERQSAKTVLMDFASTEKNFLVSDDADDIVKAFEFLSRTVTERASQKNPDIFAIDDTDVFNEKEPPKIFSGSRKTSVGTTGRSRKISNTVPKNDDYDIWDS